MIRLCSSAAAATFDFPHVQQAVRFALTRSKFAVRDLPENLDDGGKLTLVRRLVREGLVSILAI
jgi:hypothetical protein